MEAVTMMHCGSSSSPLVFGGGRTLSERQQHKQQQKLVVISTSATQKNRSGGPGGLRVLREKNSKSSGSSAAAVGPSFASICSSLRGDQFTASLRPSSSSAEWCTLHFHSPSCSSAPTTSSSSSSSSVSRRVSSTLGPLSVTSADGAVGHDKALLIEEEQKSLLKRKADNIRDDLRGASIFLVGMMGSGKTTVGRHVAEALGYCFFDSDKLVEEAAGVTVTQMFREGREEEFRNAESETIMQLSSHGRLVVATGGGAVVRPQNWGYLRHGITVWLDVPVEDLARRVVAVGCDSRPLLGQTSPESAYNQALRCLENLYEDREAYYKNADAVVSVAASATLMGLEDVNSVTPTMIAVAVLEEITSLIVKRKSSRRRGRVGNY